MEMIELTVNASKEWSWKLPLRAYMFGLIQIMIWTVILRGSAGECMVHSAVLDPAAYRCTQLLFVWLLAGIASWVAKLAIRRGSPRKA